MRKSSPDEKTSPSETTSLSEKTSPSETTSPSVEKTSPSVGKTSPSVEKTLSSEKLSPSLEKTPEDFDLDIHNISISEDITIDDDPRNRQVFTTMFIQKSKKPSSIVFVEE